MQEKICLKKIKYPNGLREIYFGKKRIFHYTNTRDFLNFISQLQQDYMKFSFNNMKMLGGGGIIDFQLLLKRAYIAHKYHKIFYDFYLRSQRGEELIFIDGGAHAGVFSDIALAVGGICYAFEPNIYLYAFLKNLYKDNPKLILSDCAISNKNATTHFYINDVVGDGSGIAPTNFRKNSGYEVQMIDFCEFLSEIIAKYGKITFVKLDIEGAEFDVLDSLIEKRLYERVEYIMVETHERFFENPKEKIENLKNKIAKNNIQNIYLDWA